MIEVADHDVGLPRIDERAARGTEQKFEWFDQWYAVGYEK